MRNQSKDELDLILDKYLVSSASDDLLEKIVYSAANLKSDNNLNYFWKSWKTDAVVFSIIAIIGFYSGNTRAHNIESNKNIDYIEKMILGPRNIEEIIT